MSRVVGVDFRENHVRLTALKVGYRSLEIERFEEELLGPGESPQVALSRCLKRLPEGSVDTLVAMVDGAHCFSHCLRLPQSARKRLSELLPFELESLLPMEIDDLVVEHSLLPASVVGAGDGEISILALATKIENVQSVIEMVVAATDRQPERVGCSSTELGQLTHYLPSLVTEEPIALIDLGFTRTDICIVQGGAVLSVRSISLGIEGFPDSSSACVARLRQTISSFSVATGMPVAKLVIMGEGAQLEGLQPFLSDRLGVATELLPVLSIPAATEVDLGRAPLFARSLAAAFHGVRGTGFDLRKGELAFERGYEHVKEKAPLFGGMMAAVLLSFLFAVWAESRALSTEHDALTESLMELTKSTFGVEIADPDEAEVELAKARKSSQEDPMPYLDGFGVAVALSETLPEKIIHDVEELDVAKGKVKLRGIVSSADDAQEVAKTFGSHRCINDQKITKITQVVNSDRERYLLEATMACPEDDKGGKSAKKKERQK